MRLSINLVPQLVIWKAKGAPQSADATHPMNQKEKEKNTQRNKL